VTEAVAFISNLVRDYAIEPLFEGRREPGRLEGESAGQDRD